MKRLIVPILAIFSVCSVLAQDAKKPQEPEYANSFFFLDKDGTLKPLERQVARVEVKSRGLAGVDTKYVLSNEHSTVRFPAKASLQFVVRLESKDDPATIVQLYSLKVAKGQRELQAGKYRTFSGSKTTLGNTAVPFDVAKYGEGSVLLKPQTPLAPGEYTWGLNSNNQAYCFGIDPASP
jgi:hypothetical protein